MYFVTTLLDPIVGQRGTYALALISSMMANGDVYSVDEDGWTVIGASWVNLVTGKIVAMQEEKDETVKKEGIR